MAISRYEEDEDEMNTGRGAERKQAEKEDFSTNSTIMEGPKTSAHHSLYGKAAGGDDEIDKEKEEERKKVEEDSTTNSVTDGPQSSADLLLRNDTFMYKI